MTLTTDFPRYADWINGLTPKAAKEAHDVLREVSLDTKREIADEYAKPLYQRAEGFYFNDEHLLLADFNAILTGLNIRAGCWLAGMSAERARHRTFLASITPDTRTGT